MSLRSRARHFLHDEHGTVIVESLLMMPILFWCYIGTFVFFDAFRAQGANVKASYVIGDALSRETGYVTPEYMDSLWTLHTYLTDGNPDVNLRITVVRYQASNDTYLVRWSLARGGPAPLTTITMAAMRNNLPEMSDADVAIVTETWVDYTPRYQVGLTEFTFENFVVTRPRFGPQLCWNSLNDGTAATATC